MSIILDVLCVVVFILCIVFRLSGGGHLQIKEIAIGLIIGFVINAVICLGLMGIMKANGGDSDFTQKAYAAVQDSYLFNNFWWYGDATTWEGIEDGIRDQSKAINDDAEDFSNRAESDR